MKFFRTEPPTPARPPVAPEKAVTPGPKLPIIEGWTEEDLASVYKAAPAKELKKGDKLFEDAPRTESFFVVFDGAIEITSTLNAQQGWPEVFQQGDCVAPLLHYAGLSYSAQATMDSTVIEIPPAVFKHLPDETQLCVHRAAGAATGKIQAYLRAVNSELHTRNLRLSQYILNENAGQNKAIQSEFVQGFIKNMRRLPLYATDLTAKLLDESTSVQEVVEGIQSDPSLVALVLRTVNSAQYGFTKKIESFYHACMILGFNNIHNLLMREAAISTMPVTRETTKNHKHSCLISVLCFEILGRDVEQQSQTAATIGLLHDLGKTVRVLMRSSHAAKSDLIDTLDTAKLGAALLRGWGIPERVCKIVEFQHHPEFMAPDLIAPEYRREAAALHIAHVLETLLMRKSLDPSQTIYTADYMSVLGFVNLTPHELLHERVLPSLARNRVRIPPEIHNIVLKREPVIS